MVRFAEDCAPRCRNAPCLPVQGARQQVPSAEIAPVAREASAESVDRYELRCADRLALVVELQCISFSGLRNLVVLTVVIAVDDMSLARSLVDIPISE